MYHDKKTGKLYASIEEINERIPTQEELTDTLLTWRGVNSKLVIDVRKVYDFSDTVEKFTDEINGEVKHVSEQEYVRQINSDTKHLVDYNELRNLFSCADCGWRPEFRDSISFDNSRWDPYTCIDCKKEFSYIDKLISFLTKYELIDYTWEDFEYSKIDESAIMQWSLLLAKLSSAKDIQVVFAEDYLYKGGN